MKLVRLLIAGLLALSIAPALADDISNGSWNTLDASNNASPPNGWPAGMFPNQVEPSARAGMGGVKRWYERATPVLSSTGSAGAYVYTPTNTSYPTAYTQGDRFCFKANFTSVGGDTLNINSLGAKKIYVAGAAALAQISAGTIISGEQVCGTYDSALNSAAGGFQVSGAVFPPGVLLAANNLSDVASAATARTNLGLGTAAVANTGTSGHTLPFLDGSNAFSTAQVLAFTSANLQFKDTSQTAPAGLWRFLDSANIFILQRSTDAGGGFATGTNPLAFNGSDVATFLNPPIFTNGPLALAQGGTNATSASAARTSLGLGTAATFASTAFAQTANNLSDLANAATARTNLGLGTAATVNTGTSGATIPLLNGGNTWSTTQILANTAPALWFKETDQTLPAGLFAITGSGGLFAVKRNTAVAGDFSTTTTPISLDASDVATFLNPPVFTSAPLAVAQGGTAGTTQAAARTGLGLGSASTFASTAFAQTANNLSDLGSASTARTNLGLGTVATHAVTEFMLSANNLSDLANAATSRTNLGLGSLATLSTVNNSNWSGTALAIANGGTGSTTAAGARTNLGLGTAATAASTDFLQVANNLSDIGNASTARTNLGLGTAATFSSASFLQASNNLSDLGSASTARTNLGLGTAATINTGTSGGTIPLLNGGNTWSGAQTFSGSVEVRLSNTPTALNTDDAGYLGVPQNTQNANYTLVLNDAGKQLYHSNSTAYAWTIPPNSSVAYPIGTALVMVNDGSGVITITQGAGVTIVWVPAGTTGNRSLAQYGLVTITKVGTDRWFLSGSGLS